MQVRIRPAYLLAVVVVVLGWLSLGGAALAQSSNSLIGTWKINVAKSKFTPGTAIKSATTKIEAAGAGVKAIVDSVNADTGLVRHWEYTANLDGKDCAITGNSSYGDSVALTRVDANTTQLVYKKAGKATATQTWVVSSDGKTRTVTIKGANTLGQALDNVQIYDKQ